MSTFSDPSTMAPALDQHVAELQETRRSARRDRQAQVAVLYPHVRTFVLKEAEAIGAGESAAEALRKVPRTMTLVTPDSAKPLRDHLFIGPHPVFSRDLQWKSAFEELDFVTSDGTNALRGHLRLTHSRLRAHGVLDIGGESISVEYHVKPQTYRMKVAKNAAYMGPQDVIKWDTQSDRWKNAEWSNANVLEFTFGVNGEEVIGEEKVYTFVASFRDIPTGRQWEPLPFSYSGMMTRSPDNELIFSLLTGVNAPTGPGTTLFPYRLQVHLSEFGYDFAGGFAVGQSANATVYGCIGEWAGAHIGGLYRLDGAGPVRLVSVHGRTLYAGTSPAAHTEIDGNRLTWSGLPEAAAAEAGLPTAGFLDFSADGGRIAGSSTGVTGTRVHADEVEPAAESELAAVFGHARKVAAEPGHQLSDLLRLSQFAIDPEGGGYYDEVQKDSMNEFYKILQNYMDPDLRNTFFSPNPPPLDAELLAIAQTEGNKGTKPLPWYASLSVPYTATAVGKFSSDPEAATLNTARSEAWLSSTTAASDVMAVQGPLLYQRAYLTRHSVLDWFLQDQKANAAKYAPLIDAKAGEWILKAREQNVGTQEQLAELEKQIGDLRDAAKKNKQYWAFAIYTYTLTPAYLNLMRLVMISGHDVDGSEFSQRVQRTVALLSVLDTTSLFAQKYASVLQMFQFAQLLPQMVDMGVELPEFSFAVEQIIAEFIKTYIVSPDPAMREAAQALRDHASRERIGHMLSIMHTAAAVSYGMMNWGFIAATFESSCAKFFGGTVPRVGIRLVGIAAVSAVMVFFAIGSADWNSLTAPQKAFLVIGATNVFALNALPIVKWGVSLGEVFTQNRAFFSSLTVTEVFGSKVLTEAQKTATNGFRGWLLQEAGPKIPADRIGLRQWWAARQAAAAQAAPLVPKGPRTLVRSIFGKNISRFMATRVAGAFAIVGIVLSAIELANSGEPMEKAVNALFLIAAALELAAVIGAWAFTGSALAIGGMLVSTVFAVVAAVGFVALLTGAILLIIFMTRPQQSPVEKFAKEQAAAANLYMQYKAAIDSFQLYRPLGQSQLAGIALYPDGDDKRALTIGSDGKVKQGAFDSSGHTAFYIDVDYLGRAKIGAPIVDPHGKPVLQTLGTDDGGTIVSKDFAGDNLPDEPRLLWYADIQGKGTYEESAKDVEHLKSAPFKLRSVYWDDQKAPKYLATDGTSGWRLTARAEEATVVTLTMVATKPAELKMNDVSWRTVAHDEQSGPALQVPGSLPRTWSISPALPEGVDLHPEDGTIMMREGVDVPPAPRKTYQLTVSNELGSVSTSFDLEIVVPPEEPVFA
jgi:hypothetical protein